MQSISPRGRGSEQKSPLPGEQQELDTAGRWFPRRVALLLLAFGLATLLSLGVRGLVPGVENWSISATAGRPVVEIVVEQLPSSLLLLGAALFLAWLLALVATRVAVWVHELEERAGPPGSVVKALGRLWVFGHGAAPVLCMAMGLVLIFVVRLGIFPLGMLPVSARPGGDLGDYLRAFTLPALTLAFLPAMLSAQAAARVLTLALEDGSTRPGWVGHSRILGTLLGQSGGMLGALLLVEMVFAWPGLGRLAVIATQRRDYPLLFGALGACALLILAGRLAAGFFHWQERRARLPILRPQPEPSPWRRTARRVWVVAALALLLIPLGFVLAGLATDPEAALHTDIEARQAPPSADHPWGTDSLGRDLQARVLRGGLVTLAMAAFVAIVAFIPGVLGGAVTGSLASSRESGAAWLVDLLLLPADALLFIPGLPGAIVLVLLLRGSAGSPGAMGQLVSLACALVLVPRAVRVFQALWLAAPEQDRELTLGLAGSGALFLGTFFAGLGLVASLDFLGLGTRPPLPSLGMVLADGLQAMHLAPAGIVAPCLVLWLCSFAGYTAADALAGYSYTKGALARLNE